jgi:hypothetical protein
VYSLVSIVERLRLSRLGKCGHLNRELPLTGIGSDGFEFLCHSIVQPLGTAL